MTSAAQSCPALCDPMDSSLPGSSVHGIFQARVLEWVALSFSAGVGSLSLLQGIFPTQESNWVLLHCRWILYQLSYQGNPPHCYYALPISLERELLWTDIKESTDPIHFNERI